MSGATLSTIYGLLAILVPIHSGYFLLCLPQTIDSHVIGLPQTFDVIHEITNFTYQDSLYFKKLLVSSSHVRATPDNVDQELPNALVELCDGG